MSSWMMGIDPGLTGAIALVSTDFDLKLWDMPTLTVTRGKISRGKNKGKPRHVQIVDEDKLYEIMEEAVGDYEVEDGVIEAVTSNSKDGVASAFSFGRVYGTCRMAMTSIGITYIDPTPAQWKPAMGVAADKDTSLFKAVDLFGDDYKLDWMGPRGGFLYDRCEAALLGVYGMKKAGWIK